VEPRVVLFHTKLGPGVLLFQVALRVASQDSLDDVINGELQGADLILVAVEHGLPARLGRRRPVDDVDVDDHDVDDVYPKGQHLLLRRQFCKVDLLELSGVQHKLAEINAVRD